MKNRTFTHLSAVALTILYADSIRAQCVAPLPITVSDPFTDVATKDPSSTVEGWGTGEIHLPVKTDLSFTESYLGAPVYNIAAADFNNDGYDDIVALMAQPFCHLHYFENEGMSGGVHQGWDGGGDLGTAAFLDHVIKDKISGTTYEASCNTKPGALVAAQFNGNNNEDILWMITDDYNASHDRGVLTDVIMYESLGTFDANGVPEFERYPRATDVGSNTPFQISPSYWYLRNIRMQYRGNHFTTTDWNGDAYTDMLFVNSYDGFNTPYQVYGFYRSGAYYQMTDGNYPTYFTGPQWFYDWDNYTLLTSVGAYGNAADDDANIPELTTDCAPSTVSSSYVSHGLTFMLFDDFDGDGRSEFIASGPNQDEMFYWERPTTWYFDPRWNRRTEIPFTPGGPTSGVSGDFDGDGDIDLVIGRDGWNCVNPAENTYGSAWLFENVGSSGSGADFQMHTSPIGRLPTDIDMVVALDVNGDGKDDILLMDTDDADGNQSGKIKISSAAVGTEFYNLEATAISEPVINPPLDQDLEYIVQVTLTPTTDPTSLDADHTITYYASNDDGEHWIEVKPGVATDFNYFGSVLRWKAVMVADDDPMEDGNASLYPASEDTPKITNMQLDYVKYSGRDDYTRTGLAWGTIDDAGTDKTVVYQALFNVPRFDADVIAYDNALVDSININDSPVSAELWHAQDKLSNETEATRKIYASYDSSADADSYVDDRVDFSAGEVDSPSDSPSLTDLTGTTDTVLKDAITFTINDGFGDSSLKLKHIDHSTPVFVGDPLFDVDYLDCDDIDCDPPTSSYADFVADKTGRDPRVITGANDGMLHAFDAVTGEESWALVPHNLLEKYVEQHDTANNSWDRDIFVDGEMVMHDIYDAVAGAWKTVVLVTQGAGIGVNDTNHLFAVDVTDPDDPKPMWEFGDRGTYLGASCSGDRTNQTTCTESCTESCNSSCTAGEQHTFVEQTYGGDRVVMFEAEAFNSNATIQNSDVTPQHEWVKVTDATADGGEYMRGLPDGITTVPGGSSQEWNCENNDDGYITCGAQMTYEFVLKEDGTFYPFFRVNGDNGIDDSLSWGIDGEHLQYFHTGQAPSGGWRWSRGNAVYLTAGEHTLNVWIREDGQGIDRIMLRDANVTPSTGHPNDLCADKCDVSCEETCTTGTVGWDDEWPECGQGAGLKCCRSFIDGDEQGEYFCYDKDLTCPQAQATMGETWSKPVIVRVETQSDDMWVAFFGSGYKNIDTMHVGRTLYAVNVITGEELGRWDFGEIPYDSSTNPSTLASAIAAGVNAVDTDEDGYADRIYVGDLEGRMWKVNINDGDAINGGVLDVSKWPSCVVFDAGDPNQTGTRVWAPIITKAAIAVLTPKRDNPAQRPNLYFGTGGDDDAPSTETYRFYAVQDTDDEDECMATPRKYDDLDVDLFEWVVGDGVRNNPQGAESTTLSGDEEGTVGDKYWADPEIFGLTIYFASAPGSIESVNPCPIVDSNSRLFWYALKDHKVLEGGVRTDKFAGRSMIADDWVEFYSKVRRGVTIVGKAPSSVVRHSDQARDNAVENVSVRLSGTAADGEASLKDEVPWKEYVPSKRFKILRWREVPL